MVQPYLMRIASFTPDMLLVLTSHNKVHMINHDGVSSCAHMTCFESRNYSDIFTLHYCK